MQQLQSRNCVHESGHVCEVHFPFCDLMCVPIVLFCHNFSSAYSVLKPSDCSVVCMSVGQSLCPSWGSHSGTCKVYAWALNPHNYMLLCASFWSTCPCQLRFIFANLVWWMIERHVFLASQAGAHSATCFAWLVADVNYILRSCQTLHGLSHLCGTAININMSDCPFITLSTCCTGCLSNVHYF